MKRSVVILISVLFLGISSFAQDGKSIYKKYSEAENVSAVYVSPAMFRMIGKLPEVEISNGNVDMSSMVESLTGLYVINSGNKLINENIRRDAERFVSSGKYELLMEAKDNGEVVHVYVTGEGDCISSFVLIAVEPGECNFICFDGKMSRKLLERIFTK